ncbi:MAG: hypothetical protein L3J43_08010 [Sulfurovum sp.]|nr:hypothetical protein [Sulfurovum sp.]
MTVKFGIVEKYFTDRGFGFVPTTFPNTQYNGMNICVMGKIKSYRGIAQIILYSQKQVSVK